MELEQNPLEETYTFIIDSLKKQVKNLLRINETSFKKYHHFPQGNEIMFIIPGKMIDLQTGYMFDPDGGDILFDPADISSLSFRSSKSHISTLCEVAGQTELDFEFFFDLINFHNETADSNELFKLNGQEKSTKEVLDKMLRVIYYSWFTLLPDKEKNEFFDRFISENEPAKLSLLIDLATFWSNGEDFPANKVLKDYLQRNLLVNGFHAEIEPTRQTIPKLPELIQIEYIEKQISPFPLLALGEETNSLKAPRPPVITGSEEICLIEPTNSDSLKELEEQVLSAIPNFYYRHIPNLVGEYQIQTLTFGYYEDFYSGVSDISNMTPEMISLATRYDTFFKESPFRQYYDWLSSVLICNISKNIKPDSLVILFSEILNKLEVCKDEFLMKDIRYFHVLQVLSAEFAERYNYEFDIDPSNFEFILSDLQQTINSERQEDILNSLILTEKQINDHVKNSNKLTKD